MDMLSDNPCRRVTVPKGESKEKEFYTIDEVKSMMEKAGFSDIQVHNTSVVMCIIATK